MIANGKAHLTPLRVIPLCIASSSYPGLIGKLMGMRTRGGGPTFHRVGEKIPSQRTEFFVFCKNIVGEDVVRGQEKILDLIRSELRSSDELADLLNDPMIPFYLERMEALGMILRIGLTPTDSSARGGYYVEYDAEASKIGVEIQAGILGIEVPEFIRMMRTMVIEKIATEVFKKLIYERTGDLAMDAVAKTLFDNMIRGTDREDFTCRLESNKPFIGIGAPVGAYLPGVAERFHIDLVLPEHSEVGNAAGAVSGNVIETLELLIRPKKRIGVPRRSSVHFVLDEGEKGLRKHQRCIIVREVPREGHCQREGLRLGC